MSEAAPSTLEVPTDLRRQLIAEAEAANRTVGEFLSDLLRDHVSRKQQARDYDEWFHAEIEQALREADDPMVEKIPSDIVMADLERRTASLRKET